MTKHHTNRDLRRHETLVLERPILRDRQNKAFFEAVSKLEGILRPVFTVWTPADYSVEVFQASAVEEIRRDHMRGEDVAAKLKLPSSPVTARLARDPTFVVENGQVQADFSSRRVVDSCQHHAKAAIEASYDIRLPDKHRGRVPHDQSRSGQVFLMDVSPNPYHEDHIRHGALDDWEMFVRDPRHYLLSHGERVEFPTHVLLGAMVLRSRSKSDHTTTGLYQAEHVPPLHTYGSRKLKKGKGLRR